MTQESDQPQPPATQPPGGTRHRQMRLGRGLAAAAYNKLVAALQDPEAKISVGVLARIVRAGASIELNAQELPDDSEEAGEDLERVTDLLGFTPPTE